MKKRGRALTRDECNTLLYVCQETGGPEVRREGGREEGRERVSLPSPHMYTDHPHPPSLSPSLPPRPPDHLERLQRTERFFRRGREHICGSLFPPSLPPSLPPSPPPHQTTWNVYNELKGYFEEDENTFVVLIRSLAEQGRLEEALALIEGKNLKLGREEGREGGKRGGSRGR